MADAFQKDRTGVHLKGAPSHYANAYNHVPQEGSHREFAATAFAGAHGAVPRSTLRTHPFGSRRAHANWERVTAFAKWVMRRLSARTVRIFADDCFSAERDATIGSAFDALLGVCDPMGLAADRLRPRNPPTAWPYWAMPSVFRSRMLPQIYLAEKGGPND